MERLLLEFRPNLPSLSAPLSGLGAPLSGQHAPLLREQDRLLPLVQDGRRLAIKFSGPNAGVQ